jgi:hypothetical protein
VKFACGYEVYSVFPSTVGYGGDTWDVGSDSYETLEPDTSSLKHFCVKHQKEAAQYLEELKEKRRQEKKSK